MRTQSKARWWVVAIVYYVGAVACLAALNVYILHEPPFWHIISNSVILWIGIAVARQSKRRE